MTQTRITDFFPNKDALRYDLYECIYNIQNKLDTYLNIDNIIEDIDSNIKSFTQMKSENNIIIDDDLVFIEKYLTVYQKINRCSIDREGFYTYFAKLIDDNMKGFINRCLVCNVDMGECNPRQLCGKWRCYEQE